jgi:hypothetical protein
MRDRVSHRQARLQLVLGVPGDWPLPVPTLVLVITGISAVLVVLTALPLLGVLGILGYETNSSTLNDWSANVAGHWGIFLVGTVIIVLGGVLLISGMARYFTVQRILLGLGA